MFKNMHGTAACMLWRTMECAVCSRNNLKLFSVIESARVYTQTHRDMETNQIRYALVGSAIVFGMEMQR